MPFNPVLLLPRFFFISILLSIVFTEVSAQKNLSLSGFVKDAENGEYLIGASVFIVQNGQGVATNVYGFYSLSLAPGNYEVRISYIGYNEKKISISLTESKKMDVELVSVGIVTGEVVISAERGDENVVKNEMSKIEIQAEQLKEIPVLFGETDIIKTIQLLPGIQSTGDGNAGFYVRGGGPDQNLILMDEAVLYNVSHLFGFFSVFSADAVKNVSIIKGGMPANYGGRLSSVLNVTLKEGNNRHFDAKGGIGAISSRLYLEGPIIKDKASFMVAGRRSYADIIAQPFLNEGSKGSSFYFYDLNTKLNYTLNEKNRFFISGYFGRDVFKFKDNSSSAVSPPTFKSDWGNSALVLRWNHLFSDKLFSNTSLIYNDYSFSFGASFNSAEFTISSAIKDYNFKSDFEYFASVLSKFKFGVNAIHHTFNPSAFALSFGEQDIQIKSPDRFALELAAYTHFETDLSDKLNIAIGLRYSAFDALGPYLDPVYDVATGRPTGDTTVYNRWQSIQWYHGLEPRFSFRYVLSKTSSIKGSATKNNQYLHLASVSGGTLPTDLWLPSSKYIKPQLAYQGAVGYFKNLKDNQYETSVEAFYKPLQNQIDFKPGTNLFVASNIDRDVLRGTGLAYGTEFFVKRNKGRLTGWIGYTWSKTKRTIPPINNGNPYSPKYDRRHDMSILATYKINTKWKVSAVWVLATGVAYTPGIGRFFGNYGVDDLFKPLFQVVTIYPQEFNTYRLKTYHRADISVIYTPANKHKMKGEWNFSIFNLYNRRNPYFVFYDTNLETGTNTAKMVYFPIIPSVTYNFKF